MRRSTVDEVRKDVVSMCPFPAVRVVFEKVGPEYRGLVDSKEALFSFCLSAEGFSVQPVRDQEKSWERFYELEKKELSSAAEEGT